MEDFTEDVMNFMFILNIKKAIFVGWALGAAVVMLLCIKYPKLVERLVLLGSIHVEGYPPFMVKTEGGDIERLTDIKEIQAKAKRVDKSIKD
jgi:pimeloyl-ACP methyl ester carboxylesterase